MTTVKARVEHLLKEMKDYNPDKRCIAANDLCAELFKDQEAIEGASVKQICSKSMDITTILNEYSLKYLNAYQ